MKTGNYQVKVVFIYTCEVLFLCVGLSGGFTMVLKVKSIEPSVVSGLVRDLKMSKNVTSDLANTSVFKTGLGSTMHFVSLKTTNTERQLDAICKVAVKKLDDIPFPFNILGGSKIKTDALSLINNQDFRSGVVSILDDARFKIPDNADKNVVELVRDKDTYNKVFAYVKQSASKSKTLTSILNNKTIETKLYEYLNSQEAMKLVENL